MRRKSFKPASDSAWLESICFKTRSIVASIMNRSLSEAKDFGRLCGGRLINECGHEYLVAVVRKGQILSFGSCNHIAGLIGHLSVGLNHSSPRGVYRCTHNQRVSHLGSLAEANGHLAANAKSPPAPRGRPDHCLIEHRRQNSAVNDPLKSNVLGGRREMRLHRAG